MIIHKDSNKSFPSMEPHDRIIEYSIIIYSFEINASWLLNTLKLLLLESFIYRNDWLAFYNNIGRKSNFNDCKCLHRSRKKGYFLLTWIFILLAQQTDDFTPACNTFIFISLWEWQLSWSGTLFHQMLFSSSLHRQDLINL